MFFGFWLYYRYTICQKHRGVSLLSDETMVERIKNGDDTAMNDVINRYFKLMWKIAGAILKNVASAEDIEECVADVFVYLWQNPEKYDAQRGKLKAWLSIVARSRAVNQYHRLTRRNDVPLDDVRCLRQPDYADGISAEETKEALNAAIRALDEPGREILIRRYYYDQKPKEISLALAMPVKQVENQLYRAKRKLRRMMTNGGA